MNFIIINNKSFLFNKKLLFLKNQFKFKLICKILFLLNNILF